VCEKLLLGSSRDVELDVFQEEELLQLSIHCVRVLDEMVLD
jgi:hypothetical protein